MGTAFCRLLADSGTEFLALDRSRVDLARPDDMDLSIEPGSVVVNCGAYTQVDQAEKEEDLATLINGESVGKLASRCAQVGARFVHFSTDYVFDGNAEQPYPVDHPRDPVNAYGRSKARGEELMEAAGGEGLLIRTSWVYAPWGKNFLKTMARLMPQRDQLKVVSDQKGRPTHVMGLAQRTCELLEQGVSGTFHVTDGGECTWHEFASAIRDIGGFDCEVDPCTTADYPLPAPRPAYSVLDTSATDALLGPPKHFRVWLADALGKLADGESSA